MCDNVVRVKSVNPWGCSCLLVSCHLGSRHRDILGHRGEGQQGGPQTFLWIWLKKYLGMLFKGENRKGMSQDTGGKLQIKWDIYSHTQPQEVSICGESLEYIQTIYTDYLHRQHKQTLYRDKEQIRVPCWRDKVIFGHLDDLTAPGPKAGWQIFWKSVFSISVRGERSHVATWVTRRSLSQVPLSLDVWERGFEDTHYHPQSTTHITSKIPTTTTGPPPTLLR